MIDGCQKCLLEIVAELCCKNDGIRNIGVLFKFLFSMDITVFVVMVATAGLDAMRAECLGNPACDKYYPFDLNYILFSLARK